MDKINHIDLVSLYYDHDSQKMIMAKIPQGVRDAMYNAYKKQVKEHRKHKTEAHELGNKQWQKEEQKLINRLDSASLKGIWEWSEQEEAKKYGWSEIHGCNNDVVREITAIEIILFAWYSRSILGCDDASTHPNFRRYVHNSLQERRPDWSIQAQEILGLIYI